MCLSIPAKIEQIEGETAQVSLGGTKVEANLQLLDDVQVGDYVLVHSGFAIQKLSEEEAQETLEMFKELENINKQMDQEDQS